MDFTPMKEYMKNLTEWRIPGNAMVIYKDAAPIFEYCTGFSDVEKGELMSIDKNLYIYSCSKITTTLTALQLFEKGFYKLDDPLYDFIPEFRDMYVKCENGEIIKSPTPITIRHLFTMTAGFNYNFNAPAFKTAQEITSGKFDTLTTIKCLAKEPLEFVPGEKWMYSLCHDVLGGFVEAVSGKSLADYAQENVFAPLGIDAQYYMTDRYRKNMAQQYKFNAVSEEECLPQLKKTDILKEGGYVSVCGIKNSHMLGENYHSGGAGIVTSVPEYAKLMATIANGGIWKNNERIIERKTIDLWRTNQLNKAQLESFNWPQLRGYGYGLGVHTMMNSPTGTPEKEMGWGGAAGANSLVDVDNNVSFFYAHHMLNNQGKFVEHKLRDLLYECIK